MPDKRKNLRTPTAPIPALVVDQQRLKCTEVTMHDFSWSGCCIIGNGLSDLSDKIALHFNGLQQLLSARIMWREGNWAGVAFERAELEHDDRRAEIRYEYIIPVVVSDTNFAQRISCTIRNASRSGVQIEANDVDQLTDDVFVKIQTFDWPIKGQVMWREFNMAGVRLIWKPETTIQKQARSIIEAGPENVFL